MTIRVTCPEGHILVVKDENAGKKVRCPKCQAVMQAPATTAGDKSSVSVAKKMRRPAFLCSSGHRFLVRDEHRGLRVKCPLCEEALRVPPATIGVPSNASTANGLSPYTPLVQANKPPFPDELALGEDKVWPLFVLVGSAAATLVGIAFWLRQTSDF